MSQLKIVLSVEWEYPQGDLSERYIEQPSAYARLHYPAGFVYEGAHFDVLSRYGDEITDGDCEEVDDIDEKIIKRLTDKYSAVAKELGIELEIDPSFVPTERNYEEDEDTDEEE